MDRHASQQRADEEARARARTEVYERLALLSAILWVVGSFILFATIVPFVARPQPYVAIAITVPIIPAAIPWLFYGRLAEWRARRILEEGNGPTPPPPSTRQ